MEVGFDVRRGRGNGQKKTNIDFALVDKIGIPGSIQL